MPQAPRLWPILKLNYGNREGSQELVRHGDAFMLRRKKEFVNQFRLFRLSLPVESLKKFPVLRSLGVTR